MCRPPHSVNASCATRVDMKPATTFCEGNKQKVTFHLDALYLIHNLFNSVIRKKQI